MENQPENIVNKFEILSVEKNGNIIDFKSLPLDIQNDITSVTKHRLPGESEYNIHSIKRIKTKMIFTIGDELKFEDLDEKKIGKITSIWISFEQMRIDIGQLGLVLHDFITKV